MRGFLFRARSVALALLLLVGVLPLDLEAQGRRSAGSVTISFLDVGQGDSILIRSPEGKTALIDAGTSSNVVNTLKSLGVNSIDLVAVSHHHSDHYGGMDNVVRTFRPKYFLASKSGHVTSTYKRLLEDVRNEDVTPLYPTSKGARVLKLGSVNLIVLPERPDEDTKNENNNSIGIVVSYGKFAVLLTGDSEETERAWWLKQCPDALKDITVLKLAHHGSRNGTNAQWLDITQPEIAVASLGTGNDYGHPHKETLDLLKKYNLTLLRTDQRGTITIESDGQDWDLVGSGRSNSEMAQRDTGSNSRSGSSGSTRKLNLNTASASDIARLPGIGSTTAEDIVAGRPYRSIDELMEVDGMGRGRVDKIRGQVTVTR